MDFNKMERYEVVKELVNREKKEIFIPEYQSKATDAETLGIITAGYFEWNGIGIMKCFKSALEEANFHSEAKKVQEMIDSIERK